VKGLRVRLLGLEVTDAGGVALGRVVDTYPFDGGGEMEMIVLRLRRFGERRMLPVSQLRLDDDRLIAPFSRMQIEDSPALSSRRFADEDPSRAKAYWNYHEPVRGLPASRSSALKARASGKPYSVRKRYHSRETN
jgi:hypothetical protein